jgi:hypothetical protein
MTQWITASGGVAISSALGLLATQLPMVDAALARSRELEKLGIIGVLTTMLILSISGLVWMAKKMLTSDRDLIERGILAANNAAAASGRLERASTELKEATIVLAQISSNCAVHNNMRSHVGPMQRRREGQE